MQFRKQNEMKQIMRTDGSFSPREEGGNIGERRRTTGRKKEQRQASFVALCSDILLFANYKTIHTYYIHLRHTTHTQGPLFFVTTIRHYHDSVTNREDTCIELPLVLELKDAACSSRKNK
jgi:hypothetical protein